ncbi:MAG: hypothetical protein U0Q07_02665 [Acidimicrobiales bacterium]
MPTRIPSLRRPPVAFANRGAQDHEAENTVAAFGLARRLGATGVASGLWRSADGAAVLAVGGSVGGRLRRRPVGDVERADLPPDVVALATLYDEVGTDPELCLLVGDDDGAVAEAIATARDRGPDVEGRLWLVGTDADRVASWRPLSRHVQLVHAVRLRALRPGPEPHAARLRQLGVDAVAAPVSEWSGGIVTLVHRFGLLAMAEDAQFERQIAEVVDAGIDAVVSDHVERLVETVGRFA